MRLSYARGYGPQQSSVKPAGNCMRGLADFVNVYWGVTYLSLLTGTKNNILVNNRVVTALSRKRFNLTNEAASWTNQQKRKPYCTPDHNASSPMCRKLTAYPVK